MFGSPRLIRNLSITGKRKKANRLAYESLNPEIAELAENLEYIGVSQDQLIALSMLVGTDYNPGGVKGIGPKNALKLVKKYGSDFEKLFKEAKWDDNFDFPWADVFNLIKKMPVTDKYDLKWKPVDKEKIKKLLVDEHDFSYERIDSALNKLDEEAQQKQQKSLSDF